MFAACQSLCAPGDDTKKEGRWVAGRWERESEEQPLRVWSEQVTTHPGASWRGGGVFLLTLAEVSCPPLQFVADFLEEYFYQNTLVKEMEGVPTVAQQLKSLT